MPNFIDKFLSLIGLILLSPLFILISVLVKIESHGGVFFLQKRVGKNNKDFFLYKFRTMYIDSERKGFLTVGGKDPRITRTGYFLRKFKLDELPQLINILKGDMKLVGPRPEVRKYVNLYNENQLKVLTVKPGITDLASITYRNENEILEKADDPENYYINKIMPHKLELNLEYLKHRSFRGDINIIFRTILAIITKDELNAV